MGNDGRARRSAMSLLYMFSFATLCLAKLGSVEPRPANPFLDPKDDPFNPLKYIASNVLTGIAFSEPFCHQSGKLVISFKFCFLPGLVMIVALIQSYFTFKWGTKFMLSMVIGEYSESRPSSMCHPHVLNLNLVFALGIAMRFGLHTMPESKGLYIVEYLFVVLSPCAFIAANYVLLGRLARHLDCSQYLLVPARRITIVFISSDISTFLIQVCCAIREIHSADMGGSGYRWIYVGLCQ
jgi:hypothetical protein